jgi:hypothetical protein
MELSISGDADADSVREGLALLPGPQFGGVFRCENFWSGGLLCEYVNIFGKNVTDKFTPKLQGFPDLGFKSHVEFRFRVLAKNCLCQLLLQRQLVVIDWLHSLVVIDALILRLGSLVSLCKHAH